MNYSTLILLFGVLTHIVVRPSDWIHKIDEDYFGVNIVLIGLSLLSLVLTFFMF